MRMFVVRHAQPVVDPGTPQESRPPSRSQHGSDAWASLMMADIARTMRRVIVDLPLGYSSAGPPVVSSIQSR